MADHKEIEALGKTLGDTPIDILLNNAGVYAGNSDESFGTLNYQAWNHAFRINTMAAAKMAEVFAEQVAHSDKRLIAALSSLMEPIIMVVLGTLIGGMVIAMYLPIFKMGQVV